MACGSAYYLNVGVRLSERNRFDCLGKDVAVNVKAYAADDFFVVVVNRRGVNLEKNVGDGVYRGVGDCGLSNGGVVDVGALEVYRASVGGEAVSVQVVKADVFVFVADFRDFGKLGALFAQRKAFVL